MAEIILLKQIPYIIKEANQVFMDLVIVVVLSQASGQDTGNRAIFETGAVQDIYRKWSIEHI